MRVIEDAGARFGTYDSEAGVAEALVGLARHAFRATAVTIVSLDDAQAWFPDEADALRATRLEAVCAISPVGGEQRGLSICFYGRERDFNDEVLAPADRAGSRTVKVLRRTAEPRAVRPVDWTSQPHAPTARSYSTR